jgi:hypothetical protein
MREQGVHGPPSGGSFLKKSRLVGGPCACKQHPCPDLSQPPTNNTPTFTTLQLHLHLAPALLITALYHIMEGADSPLAESTVKIEPDNISALLPLHTENDVPVNPKIPQGFSEEEWLELTGVIITYTYHRNVLI